MNDIAEEGVFVWDDGSAVTYIKHAPGEPNNSGNEDCMSILPRHESFNDLACEAQMYFICETDYNTLTHSCECRKGKPGQDIFCTLKYCIRYNSLSFMNKNRNSQQSRPQHNFHGLGVTENDRVIGSRIRAKNRPTGQLIPSQGKCPENEALGAWGESRATICLIYIGTVNARYNIGRI